jgi:hypothetical protein
MMSRTEEDFELELRSLPGVMNVGISHRDNGDVDVVTLIVSGQDSTQTRNAASQIGTLYYPDAVVIVDDVKTALAPHEGDGPRVALVRAEFNASDGVCEVQLSYAGRPGVGRAGSGPLIGGAQATLAALRDLGFTVPFSLMAVVNVATVNNWPVIVTLRSLTDDAYRFGIAESDEDLVSAARATLDALNRFLSGLEDNG